MARLRVGAGVAVLVLTASSGCGSTTNTGRAVTGAGGAFADGGIRANGGDASRSPASGGAPSADAATGPPRCVPGDQQSCACIGGRSGVHVCDDSGRWGLCTGCTTELPDASNAPEAGTCTAPSVACGGTCVDLGTDTHHCGECSHDCLGGACAAGRCAPTPLATNLAHPTSLAVDATHLYWIDAGTDSTPSATGSVVRMPIAGGPVQTLASEQYGPLGIAVDRSRVYWGVGGPGGTYDGALMAMPLAGGNPETLASEGMAYFGAIAVDDQSVYWVNGPMVLRALNFATKMITTVDATGGTQGTSLVIKDGILYWPSMAGNSNGIGMADTRGGGASLIVSTDDAYAIGVGGGYLFWSAFREGTINQASTSGDNAKPIATGQGDPRAIVVDDARVYWANGSGTIRCAPLGGGATRTLATGQASPAALVQDAKYLYWTNMDGGTVMRLPK